MAVVAVSLLLFITLIARLGQVQLTDRDQVTGAAAAVNTREIVIPAVRGRILDRAGKPLADNTSRLVVTLERKVVVESADHGRSLLTAVAKVLQRPVDELVAKTWLCGEAGAPAAPACWNGSPQAPIPIASGVDARRALTLTEQPERFPGIAVTAEPVRLYPGPEGANAAHLVGYLGRVSEKEITDSRGKLTADDVVGRAGLEQQYDEQLRGSAGREVVAVDPRGLVTRVLSRTDPIPGQDLLTSIDAGAQATAEKELASGLQAARGRGERADSGSVVILDVRTGAVVAAASAPTYDPNVWTGGIRASDYEALTDASSGRPLLNRFSGSALAPASTIKALSLPAAVSAGADLTGIYECGSSYRIGNRDFKNFESSAHGQITLARGIEVSCDTIFYRFAYQAWLDQGGLNATSDARDPFVRTDRAFGLGAVTGIDLPGETAGRIPGREGKRAAWEDTKADTCARATKGYPEVAASDPGRAAYLKDLAIENCATGFQFRAGDEANISIGQGELSASPLQMASVYAAVANGGTVRTPRIGAALVDASGKRTAIPAGPSRASGLDTRVGDYLRDALRSVVTGGTAKAAFEGMDRRWPVAGKTGTAEVFGNGDTSWFVSYAPANSPRYAVSVALTQSGTGAEAAAPVAASIHAYLARSPLASGH